MNFKKNILLAKHTTFKIGGPAKYFFVAKNKEELIEAIKWAKENKIPFFILGAGSNVLALDEGFNGLIIKIENLARQNFAEAKFGRVNKLKIENCNLYAEAGTKLEDLVELSLRNSLTGLEWAAGIPGTVGGAVYGNAQAFDAKISDIVKNVEVLDSKTLKIKELTKKQCQFSEKNSIFKKNKNFIILSAILKIKKGNKKEIQQKIKEQLALRKQRHPLKYPSAGSVFINKPGLPPSAFLVEKAGLKGIRVGNAQISEKHAGFIVNLGGAKAKDVLELIKLIKQKVKNKFGINLKEEIQVISPR